MSKKKQVIEVKGTAITIIQVNQTDYISLTDIARNLEDGLALIEKAAFERRAREVYNRSRPNFYFAVLPNGMSNFPSAITRSLAGADANCTFPEKVPETRVEVMSMTVTVNASFPYKT
jgi:hypothetical protein